MFSSSCLVQLLLTLVRNHAKPQLHCQAVGPNLSQTATRKFTIQVGSDLGVCLVIIGPEIIAYNRFRAQKRLCRSLQEGTHNCWNSNLQE